ncbi:MAG: hypothetical protein HY203_09075 [Nitrospirae bacterium]|nr:hypothetical protein [Nitrospirota bacterium]
MIFVGTDRIIKDILEEYVENLQFLWERRCAELQGQDMFPRSYADLEERVAANADALILAGSDAVPLLTKGLGGDEAAVSLASGYVLLSMGDEKAAHLVLEGFNKASGPCLEGLIRALSYGSIEQIATGLQEAAVSGPVLQASAAAEVLAFHNKGDYAAGRINEFLACDEASVRRRAWRVVALLDGLSSAPRGRIPINPDAYEQGVRDEDQAVRVQVLEAAAWTRQPWLLDYCRCMAFDPSPDRLPAIRLLAILGEPADLDLILTAGRTASLGLARFDVLTSMGHPAVLETLLEAIKSEDPSVAVMAGSSYSRITGADVESEKRVRLPPADGLQPDEFEVEFLEEAALPDRDKAGAHWASVREVFMRGVRWRRGIDMSRVTLPHLPDPIDNRARWETFLRARFRGLWQGSIADRERFPLQKSEGI